MPSLHFLFLTTLFLSSVSSQLTCQDPPLNSYPYCNPDLPISERVYDLLNRLTDAERVNLTNSDQGGVPRLGVPTLGHTECNRGTWTGNAQNVPQGMFPTTLFPQATNLAQSFDRRAFYNLSRAVSNEVRAKHNLALNNGIDPGNDGFGLVCWAPMIDICRDPRWGRCQEGYGEDPLLTSELVYHYVRGVQYDPTNTKFPQYKQTIATCKHFNAHSGPYNFQDVIIDYPDWILTHQPGFKKCTEAGVSAYMCSNNAINGVPNCANAELLLDILRNEWGFQGYVVGDCGATAGIHNTHHYANNVIEAQQMALKNGADWNGACGGPRYGELYNLNSSLHNLTLPIKYINNALFKVLPQWFELGLLDPPQNNPWSDLNLTTLYESHKEVAYRLAVDTFILMKNNNNKLKLPLQNGKTLNGSIKFALVGPCINNSICYEGDYAGTPFPWDIISPLDAFINEYGMSNVIYASGCMDTACSTTGGFDSVFDAVLQADVVVYVGGISTQQEGEGNDRSYIELPYNQSLLFSKMYEVLLNNASGNVSKVKPIISCLCYGAPTIDNFMFNVTDKLIAIGYGGEEIGNALVSLLLGYESFSGRTSITWYNNTQQLGNITHYVMNEYPGRTYRYLIEKPSFSFGYGLSYTNFVYSNLKLSSNTIQACESLTVTITLQNKGTDITYQNNQNEVTMLFLRTLNPNITIFKEPNIKLVNFTKNFGININDSIIIELMIKPEQMFVIKGLSYNKMIVPGEYQIFIGGYMTMDHFNEETLMFNYPTLINDTFTITGNEININNC